MLHLFIFVLGVAVGVAGLHYYRKFVQSRVKAGIKAVK